MKKLTWFFALGALVFGAALASADHGPHGMRMRVRHGDHLRHDGHDGHIRGGIWQSEHLARALDLTADQRTAAKELSEEFAAQAEPLWTSARDQRKQVHELIEGANPDATAIGQRMIAMHQAHQQLKALHESFDTKFSALLDADQRERFEKMREMRKMRFGSPEDDEMESHGSRDRD